MPVFFAILFSMYLICSFHVKFSTENATRTLLIKIVESGYYLYIVLGEPREYRLFCLVYEKIIFSLCHI